MKNKTKFVQAMVIFLTASASMHALSHSECTRTVKNTWTRLDSSTSFWVTFTDGGSSIWKNEDILTDGQMARFVSIVLTAQSTGKKLRVRYPEDDMTCPPPSGSARSDVQGIWLLKD